MSPRTSETPVLRAIRGARARVDLGAVGAWTLGSALVVYLGAKGGGYDVVVRSEVGVAVWWIVLLGALAGVLPGRGLGRATWVAFGLLAALVAWTALGAGSSESRERALIETGRLAMYLGVFVLAACACTRERVRPLLGGVATGIVTVAALAVLSRLHPAWFADDVAAAGRLLPSTRARVAYPLNYWNAVAALVAVGLPLVLGAAVAARSLAARCLSCAALPVLGLCWYLTLSRGGALAIAAAACVFLALAPRRISALLALLVGGAGAALLIAAVQQRPALADGLATRLAHDQGDQVLVIMLAVCAGVAVLRLGAGLAENHGLVPALRVPRGVRHGLVALAVVGATAGLLAVVAPSEVSGQWAAFKDPHLGVASTQTNASARFASTSGNGRYQYWRSAVDAFETRPVRGIGAGSYEFWWARHATLPGFVRNAHSLYFETLAETGLVGLALLLGLLGSVLAVGLLRLRRCASDHRALVAAALAGCVAFCVSASVDWIWQIAVLPVTLLLLAAAVLAAPAAERARHGRTSRAVLGAVAVAALAAMIVPLAGTVAVRDSQRAALRHDIPGALAAAATAARVQPYAATPVLQRALVLELGGDLAGAAGTARTAWRREPTNSRAPLVLARIEAERGRVGPALTALRAARALNRASWMLR